MWLDGPDSRSWIETRLTQTPIQDSTIQPLGNQRQRSKFKRLWITIVIVYIFPLNGYWELESNEEPCIYANGKTITSFAWELNPTGVGEHIYIYIYIYILSSTDRSVSFYQNSSVRLDGLDSRSLDRNPVDTMACKTNQYHFMPRR